MNHLVVPVGISQMSVDLVIRDLARLTRTSMGHGPNAQVKGIIGEIGAVGGPDGRQKASMASVGSTSASLPYLKADHPRPPRLHATTTRLLRGANTGRFIRW